VNPDWLCTVVVYNVFTNADGLIEEGNSVFFSQMEGLMVPYIIL